MTAADPISAVTEWLPEHLGAPSAQDPPAPRGTRGRRPADDEPDMPEPPPPSANGKPDIFVAPGNAALTRMADELEAAILASDLPAYQRGGLICTLKRDGASAMTGVTREIAEPQITPTTLPHLREWAGFVANWLKYDGQRRRWVDTWPSQHALETLNARPSWGLPVVEAIVEAPTLRPDGTVLDAPGYDAQTGILFVPRPDAQWLAVADAPGEQEVQAAIGLLRELVQDFPFTEVWHRSAALAALLTLVVRPAICGPCPFFLFTGNAPGAGKGKLVNVFSLIATGRMPSPMSETGDDDELRKRITSLAISGARLAFLDNLSKPLGGAALDAVLTSTTWSDRVLGASKQYTGPITAIWMGTGNNTGLKGDMARRVIPSYILTQEENPDERSNFLHPDLEGWVRDERPRLVHACLTIVRAYVVAGRPRPAGLVPIGSYGAWDSLVRGALLWVGEDDPAKGRQEMRLEADSRIAAFRMVLGAWRDALGDGVFTLSDVRKMCRAGGADEMLPVRDALQELAPNKSGDDWDVQRAGYAFRQFKNRVFDGLRLTHGERGRRGVGYQVVAVRVEDCF